jgi:hypothetical protein
MHRKNFVRGLPTLAFHGINSDSAGNYQLMEADSDREDQNGRKILKAVTISGSASSNSTVKFLLSDESPNIGH